MSSVHLSVAELKRYGQTGLEPRLAVAPPDYERSLTRSVVNQWYDRNETPWIRKPKSACYIQDVMVWENDNPQRLLTAAILSEREE